MGKNSTLTRGTCARNREMRVDRVPVRDEPLKTDRDGSDATCRGLPRFCCRRVHTRQDGLRPAQKLAARRGQLYAAACGLEELSPDLLFSSSATATK
jgi:hypothetical protein